MISTILDDDFRRESFLVIVIETENLERMKLADPITLESVERGGKILANIKYPANLSMLIAYEEDDAELYRLATSKDREALLLWLERGREWKKGDGVVAKI